MADIRLQRMLACALIACALNPPAAAAEVGGIRFDDTSKVAGKDLKLNGAGVRIKFVFRVYAAGLYLPERKNTAAEIIALPGPRRVQLVMLRDVSSEDFHEAFMKGLHHNIDPAEMAKIINQTTQLGDMFSQLPAGLKKGDVLHLDWIPGIGTECELNGKKIGEAVPDMTFYNALLKIWIGDKPVDNTLKPALLGEAK